MSLFARKRLKCDSKVVRQRKRRLRRLRGIGFFLAGDAHLKLRRHRMMIEDVDFVHGFWDVNAAAAFVVSGDHKISSTFGPHAEKFRAEIFQPFRQLAGHIRSW